jgi:hypothetical protein
MLWLLGLMPIFERILAVTLRCWQRTVAGFATFAY